MGRVISAYNQIRAENPVGVSIGREDIAVTSSHSVLRKDNQYEKS